MSTAPSLYGLLYVAEAAEKHVNLGAGDPLAIYAANAALLAKSAAAQGLDFALVTNRPERVSAALAAVGLQDTVTLREQAFTLDVPAGIPFHSAHYKLELVRLFGEGCYGAFPALVDLDAVLVHPLRLPDDGRFWAYDISRQNWQGGPPRAVSESLEMLAGPLALVRWFGGEFLAGPAARFAELWSEIASLWPTYLARHAELWHSGDEMVLTAALSRLAEAGFPLGDAGTARMVARWWSRRTTTPMGPLDEALQAAALHLPADKDWLAGQAALPFDAARLRRDFRAHAARRLPGERVRSLAERLLRRPAVHVPKIA